MLAFLVGIYKSHEQQSDSPLSRFSNSEMFDRNVVRIIYEHTTHPLPSDLYWLNRYSKFAFDAEKYTCMEIKYDHRDHLLTVILLDDCCSSDEDSSLAAIVMRCLIGKKREPQFVYSFPDRKITFNNEMEFGPLKFENAPDTEDIHTICWWLVCEYLQYPIPPYDKRISSPDNTDETNSLN